MKKIVFLCLVLVSFVSAEFNECITDIYFGNGVWNDYAGANRGREALERRILSIIYHGNRNAFRSHHFTDRGDPVLNKNIVLLAFNWTGSSPDEDLSFKSRIEDLIETFYQLKDNGQLEGYGLYEYLKFWLTQDPNTPAKDILFDKIDDIVSEYSRAVEGANLVDMIEQYEEISLKKSHRVLLVAHSQGNLFGNEVYDNLISWERGYFKMVSVATPADNVLGKSTPYTTLTCDQIIEKNLLFRDGIPRHLPANINCTGEEKSKDGHQFIPNYLSNHLSLHKILDDISQSLSQLDKTPSQWKIVKEPNHCNSCDDYVVKVEHRFDTSMHVDDDVLPFNTQSFRLYSVNNRYVLASCGGVDIEELKNDDESRLCSRLIGTSEAIPKMDTLIEGVCIGIVDSDIDYRFDDDSKELLVGSIGDNYWSGACTHYDRHITLLIENSEKLKSFKIKEVGFDDWMGLSINNKVFYESPYQLPPSCELGTSFIKYPNLEIRQDIKEGLNRLDMSVIVTGGGEGWFKVQLN